MRHNLEGMKGVSNYSEFLLENRTRPQTKTPKHDIRRNQGMYNKVGRNDPRIIDTYLRI